MTKRFGNFTDNTNKKQKTKGTLDDLWGDDLDAKDVDDCFMLATQVWEQDDFKCTQRNNVSILPPYNAFRQTSNTLFTSTQSDPLLNSSMNFPSTSKAPIGNGIQKSKLSTTEEQTVGKNSQVQVNGFKRTRSFESSQSSPYLESKMKKLQEQYLAKEGEVSILRSQLKEIRTNVESEQTKKQKQWSERVTATTKQLNAVKSELEFKNLEIANLKQKVIEVVKLHNLDTSLYSSQNVHSRKSKVSDRYATSLVDVGTTVTASHEIAYILKDFKIQPVIEALHPLQKKIPTMVFTFPFEEKYLLDIKHKHTCRNTIPFLQNRMSQKLIDRLIRLQPKVTLLNDDRQLSFDYVFCEMSKLMKCNVHEMELEENLRCINKVLCVSEQLVYNLYQFLHELEENTQLSKVDVIYLGSKFEDMNLNRTIFDTEEWCENEMGINARQSIACISEILPYSNYLKGYILQNKFLVFKGDEEYLRCLPRVKSKLEKEYCNQFDYLSLISSVVIGIKKLKQSRNFPGFLSAVLTLLTKICLCAEIDEIYSQLYTISRQITFCRPNVQVLLLFTEFLKSASLNKMFVNELCKMPATATLKVNRKEKISYYNKDTCVIQVFCSLVEDNILKRTNLKLCRLYSNVLKFIANIIECNPRWLFYHEDKHCDCLCKIVKLWVDVMYQTVEQFPKENTTFKDELLLKHSELLNSLNFRVYDLVVKYVGTYSQYKDVVKYVLDCRTAYDEGEFDDELHEDLNGNVEIPTIDDEMFSKISLWN